MHNYQTLIEKAKKGFETLDLPQSFKSDALERLSVWLVEDMYAPYVPQITHLIASGQWEFLLDSFYQVIPFGTGGRRGLVGVGPNRINPWNLEGMISPFEAGRLRLMWSKPRPMATCSYLQMEAGRTKGAAFSICWIFQILPPSENCLK